MFIYLASPTVLAMSSCALVIYKYRVYDTLAPRRAQRTIMCLGARGTFRTDTYDA